MCFAYMSNAQVSNEGTPFSWGFASKKSVAPVLMKSFDLNQIKAEDEINDQDRTIPYRYGYELKVNLGLDTNGVWDELDNGDRIWRINIISDGAKTLNVIFDKYRIPRGAKLYLYSDDKKDLLGAYTNIFNRPDEMLGTWLVDGDNIWLEYYEPASVRGQGKLNIAKVIHGYRSVTDAMVNQKALGSSGDCNHDVDCPIGNDFDAIKDELKRSVGFIILNGFVCTGTLINNTSNDRAPYFLTANHCESGSTSTWAFRFNWISPDPSCGNTLASEDATEEQTTSGATVLAANPKSDMKLLQLDGGLDSSWNLNWAGWDRSGTAPEFVVGIHHPSGDIMKVCRENQAPSTTLLDFNGEPETETWRIDNWDIGVTERGSSGSAIFDPNGRIIGQLAGGTAACNGTDDNNEPDFYGRFDTSWDSGRTDATRLSNWLDPTGTNAVTLDLISQEGATPPTPPAPEEEKEVSLFFSPSTSSIKINNEIDSRLEYNVYNISGNLVSTGVITDETGEIVLLGRSSRNIFCKHRKY